MGNAVGAAYSDRGPATYSRANASRYGGATYTPNGYQNPGAMQAAGRSQGPDPLQAQLQGLWNLGILANAPQQQGITNNVNSYLQQLDMIGANQRSETGYINQDDAIARQRLGLQGEQLGIQRGALGRQAVLDPRLHQLNLDQLQQQGAQNIFQAGQQNRQLSSQATTAGALQSVGARQGFSDIAQQLQFGQQDVLRGTQRENLTFDERQAQLKDQNKQLDLAAKGLDIDGKELANRTSRALQQLGLSSALSTQDVVRAINDLNAGRYNPIQGILGTLYQASGIRPVAGGR